MRKLYFLKTMLLLCALVAGSASTWATTYKSYTGGKEMNSTTISTTNVSSGTVGVISWTGTSCSYSSNRVNIAANGSITFTASSGNVITKIIIVSGSSDTYYGTWTSSPSVTPTSSSSGTTTFDGLSANSVTVTTSTAFRCTSASSISIHYAAAPSVAAPTFSPAAGSVAYGTEVTLSQKDNKSIYYTTDGSDPTSSSTPYSTAITIDQDMTIKAIAVDGSNESAVASATYTVERPAAPTFSEEGEVESGTEVTVTAPSGCTLYYTTNGDDPITLGTSAGSNSKTFTITEAQTIKTVSRDSHGFYSDVASATYSIAVFSDPTFSVSDMSIAVGDQKEPVVTTNSSGDVTYVSGNTSIATIVDGKINAVAKGTVTITANLAKDATNHYKAASITFEVTVSLAPVWESTSKGIDVLTYDSFFNSSEGNNSPTYTNFSGKSESSSAVYAGQAGKQKNLGYIQIRQSNNNSGIVTTTSGGKARVVRVNWNSSTANGNKIDIYGKNSSYSQASDLFDNSEHGDKLGSIVKGTSTELDISGDYAYIGIRSYNGTCYLDEIDIYWEGDAVSLADDEDYTPTAKDYAKVTLSRSFQEGWNGVVLPFDLTASVKTALGASDVKTLGSATEESGAVTLNFVDAELPVAAGTPVLVKLGASLESGDVVINGAEIKTTTPTSIVKEVEGSGFVADFTFTGTYTNQTITDEAYFVAADKFYHKAEGVNLSAKPFRAYITQETISGARMAVNFNLEDSETSGIADIHHEATANSRYYDLQGRRVNATLVNSEKGIVNNSQLKKGLYIVNGKKVLVK